MKLSSSITSRLYRTLKLDILVALASNISLRVSLGPPATAVSAEMYFLGEARGLFLGLTSSGPGGLG